MRSARGQTSDETSRPHRSEPVSSQFKELDEAVGNVDSEEAVASPAMDDTKPMEQGNQTWTAPVCDLSWVNWDEVRPRVPNNPEELWSQSC